MSYITLLNKRLNYLYGGRIFAAEEMIQSVLSFSRLIVRKRDNILFTSC